MKKLCLLPLLLAMLLAGCLNPRGSYLATANANWKLSLPESGSLVYSADTGASFHGDGLRYHVFDSFPEVPLPWHTGPDASENRATLVQSVKAWAKIPTPIYHPTTTHAAEAWLDELTVPAEQRPDYAACYLYYAAQPDNSELLLYWDPELQRLYLVESFL